MGTGERGEASGMAGVFAGALWLAKREVRRAWISYPLTGVLLMLMGFYVVPSVSGVFEFDGPGTAAFALLAWVTAERLDRRDLPESGSK
jgi:hypothetical protein